MAVSRFQAEQGDTVRLKVRFERDGNLFDPFDISKVEIRRRTGATTTALEATIDAGSVVQEAQGIFYVDWVIPADQDVGAYVDRWYFTVDSGDSEITDDASFAVLPEGSVVPAVGGYITVSEIRDTYLPGSLLDDADINVLIAEGTEYAEKYTGRWFGARALTINVDGTGAPYLILPYTIRSIESLTVVHGSPTIELDVDDFVIKGRWLVHKNYLPYPWTMDNAGCFICGCVFGDIFPRGQDNIEVVGTFGTYEDVPALIKRAVGLWVMHAGRDDHRTSPAAYNFSSESVEQHSYSLRTLNNGDIRISGASGIDEVDHILNLFLASGKVFVV